MWWSKKEDSDCKHVFQIVASHNEYLMNISSNNKEWYTHILKECKECNHAEAIIVNGKWSKKDIEYLRLFKGVE